MEESNKYEEAIEVVDRLFFAYPVIGNAETKLVLIRQVMMKSLQLSGFPEDSQKYMDAMQLLYAIDEIIFSLNQCGGLFAGVSTETTEILGQEFPKKKDILH